MRANDGVWCISQAERELLRNEIAVMKLLKHPSIVRLEAVFETRLHMYIVLEKVRPAGACGWGVVDPSWATRRRHLPPLAGAHPLPTPTPLCCRCWWQVHGGELFSRIVGRARFSESEARALMKPLLAAVAYIHSMGIIHRDIKVRQCMSSPWCFVWPANRHAAW
jgi:hypothetical protein